MSTTSTEPQPTEPPSRALRAAFRAFAAIEKVGNKLPNPFWLFWILAGVVIVLSAILAATGVSTVHPGTHDTIEVRSLLSKAGLTTMVEGAVDNFATFPPLATILIVGFGIAVAEASGLFTTLLRRMVARVPGKYLTFALSMTAMVAHVAGDAAYVTLIPLGALIFRAAYRSPVLGCVVAYVSISASTTTPHRRSPPPTPCCRRSPRPRPTPSTRTTSSPRSRTTSSASPRPSWSPWSSRSSSRRSSPGARTWTPTSRSRR